MQTNRSAMLAVEQKRLRSMRTLRIAKVAPHAQTALWGCYLESAKVNRVNDAGSL
jgi:hypothetical protein